MGDSIKILKTLSLIGGIYEIFFGFLMIFFIVPLLNLLGAGVSQLNLPIFNQTAGLLAIIIGLILICSSFNVEKYAINIIAITYLRFLIQIIIMINIFLIPAMFIGLLLFGLMDLIFGLMTIYLLKESKISLNIFKNI